MKNIIKTIIDFIVTEIIMLLGIYALLMLANLLLWLGGAV